MIRPQLVATDRLCGVRAVVTGGARGIGAAIVRRARAEGAEVVIIDRLADRGATIAGELGATFIEADLGDPVAASAASDEAIDTLGGVDLLVNSVGILRRGPLLDLTAADWDHVFAVNTRSMLLTMQRAATAMIAAGSGGRIVNIASMAAKAGGADEGAYAASKAAVVALSRAAAHEWGRHDITVNSVCPGYVLTEMGADTRTSDDVRRWSAKSPLNRLADPADVAGVVCFLASGDGGYLTGQAVNVTGGMVMH